MISPRKIFFANGQNNICAFANQRDIFRHFVLQIRTSRREVLRRSPCSIRGVAISTLHCLHLWQARHIRPFQTSRKQSISIRRHVRAIPLTAYEKVWDSMPPTKILSLRLRRFYIHLMFPDVPKSHVQPSKPKEVKGCAYKVRHLLSQQILLLIFLLRRRVLLPTLSLLEIHSTLI